jgi:hypothetical protein
VWPVVERGRGSCGEGEQRGREKEWEKNEGRTQEDLKWSQGVTQVSHLPQWFHAWQHKGRELESVCVCVCVTEREREKPL